MGECQIQPVLPGLCQHLRKARTGMRLIHGEKEISPLLFRHILAAECRQPYLRDHEGREQTARVLPNTALGDIHQEYLALVHGLPDIKGIFRLPHNAAHERIRHELPDLVQNRGNGFTAEARGVPGKLCAPEVPQVRISQRCYNPLAPLRIGEESGHVKESGAWIGQEGEDRIAQNVFEPRPPAIGPDFLEDRDDTGGGKRMVRRVNVCQRIKRHGTLSVGGIEVDHGLDHRIGHFRLAAVD